jgi:hypothetical protein
MLLSWTQDISAFHSLRAMSKRSTSIHPTNLASH